jgi:hypothetical protein
LLCRTDAAIAPATAVGLDRVATLMTSTLSSLGFPRAYPDFDHSRDPPKARLASTARSGCAFSISGTAISLKMQPRSIFAEPEPQG